MTSPQWGYQLKEAMGGGCVLWCVASEIGLEEERCRERGEGGEDAMRGKSTDSGFARCDIEGSRRSSSSDVNYVDGEEGQRACWDVMEVG